MKKSLLAYFQTLYFKRGFFLIFSAFFCLFSAICALVLLVYAAVTLKQFEHDVESFSDVAIGHAEEIMAQATRVLDVFDQNTLRSCSNEHMEQLRRTSYSNDYVQDVIYIEDNRPRCSLMLSNINRSPLLSPDLIYKNKYRVWYNADNTLNRYRQMIYVGSSNYLIVLNPNSFINIPSYSHNIKYAFVEKDNGVVIISNVYISNIALILSGESSATNRFYSDNKYFLLKPMPNGNILLVVNADEPKSYRFAFILFLYFIPIFMVLSLLLAVLVSRTAQAIKNPYHLLNNALRQKEFELHYQPIIKLGTAQIVGCEALIRWRHSDGHLITPDSFIPMIRQVGLMKDLTLFVINEALQTANMLRNSYPEMFVSINLEAAEFEDMSVFNYLVEQIAVYDLDGANVNVELTESSMIEPQKAAPMVELYQQQGIDVAIDDFGTGYSGLSYLERVKANKLKIDKSFVGNISDHSPTDIVLSHIVSMAHCLNLHIVAEGIETPIQEAYLKSLGVAYAQGWLYSKALTQDALITFLAEKGETGSDAS
ncbi:EAL domain-containing protein [Pectobacterium brasiliense]|uniref:EAL domain-containing protein n=1 Tax=Pectobacterium brasiliense TaxID=180957 RepID=UPI0006510AA3|nr:EAL domain-containing protein [Pectobacterium brasiliense]KMK83972.1 EAL domain-containing protein [Pectobacterium brasiliense ICMP 19477]